MEVFSEVRITHGRWLHNESPARIHGCASLNVIHAALANTIADTYG
jgi:hypothetical protein